MKRLILAGVAAVALVAPASASATIHPLVLGWYCGEASGNPPGQTPGGAHSDQSSFRAVQATGVITITDGGVVFNPDNPASKFSTFDVATETGTPSNPGALHCAGAPSP